MRLKDIVGATAQFIIKVALFAFLIMYIVKAATAAYDYGYRVFTEPAMAFGDGRIISVSVAQDASALDVGKMLQEKGLIRDGSTNDFANSLGIPKNMLRAADVVVNGRNFACDVGKFNHSIFIYVAAFGIFTDVSYGTPQDTKNVLGHAAYLIEGVKRLPSVRSYPLKITCKESVIEGEFLYGMITNSHSVGGFRGITGQNVALDDGLFEVTLIRKPTNPLEINNIIRALVDKRVKSEHIYTFTTEKLKVESEEPVAWTLDGEFGGEHLAVEIESWHQALEIRVPKEPEE